MRRVYVTAVTMRSLTDAHLANQEGIHSSIGKGKISVLDQNPRFVFVAVFPLLHLGRERAHLPGC
jgi:hypothetical protein